MSRAKQSLQDRISTTNAGIFFREFSFSSTKFTPPDNTELELADHVVVIDGRLLIFQLKEREKPTKNESKEKKWFEKKIVRAATRQIRDTLGYLERYCIDVSNERGRRVRLGANSAVGTDSAIKVVVYRPGDRLPHECGGKKFYKSKSSGVIHLINDSDWIRVLHTLVTPSEVIEYLDMRESLCAMYPGEMMAMDEKSIVGQFLLGEKLVRPSLGFAEFVDRHRQNYEKFDLTGILSSLGAKGTAGNSGVPGMPSWPSATISEDYYPILEDLARLGRTDCGFFKQRFQLCWDSCRDNQERVTRFVASSVGVGFIFLVVPSGRAHVTGLDLAAYTEIHKYDRRLRCCIGISFSPLSDDERYIAWMRIEREWVHDHELDALVAQANLPPLRTGVFPTYEFS